MSPGSGIRLSRRIGFTVGAAIWLYGRRTTAAGTDPAGLGLTRQRFQHALGPSGVKQTSVAIEVRPSSPKRAGAAQPATPQPATAEATATTTATASHSQPKPQPAPAAATAKGAPTAGPRPLASLPLGPSPPPSAPRPPPPIGPLAPPRLSPSAPPLGPWPAPGRSFPPGTVQNRASEHPLGGLGQTIGRREFIVKRGTDQ